MNARNEREANAEMGKRCPPCTGNCNQGRACPRQQIDGLRRDIAPFLGEPASDNDLLDWSDAALPPSRVETAQLWAAIMVGLCLMGFVTSCFFGGGK